MAKETDVNFEYIPHERYILEIKDLETERIYYSRRIGSLPKAISTACEYNILAGLSARILDTKTGEII